MQAPGRQQSERPSRRRRSDGERSRKAILREAAQLATVEGLDGLSIARLAEAVGMSKSGLFAHFGSKEELQLATVATASELFDEIVINPALGAPTGIERLRALCENYLRHVEDSVYPGGCFFASAAAELDTRLGPVRDLAIEVVGDWLEQQRKAVRDAQAEGAIDPSEDPEQLAFELEAYLMAANQMFVISQDPAPIEQARRAIARRLLAATPTAG
ncbi:MAG TPA: TetR/AcrR family transcriptional regulator [Conexibacter sp.]|nr:TetR/AcrR family transcriptional regulator [Conexibacter sp.]